MFAHPSDSLSRRRLLRDLALGFGSVALTSLLAEDSSAATGQKAPHFKARAKRVLFLFMKGGPSHLDTFDPKPLLDKDHGKPLPFKRPLTFAEGDTGTLLKSPWKFR